MKKILIAAMTILTMNVMAGTIVDVPYTSHQELFNGTIRRIEPQIKAALIQKGNRGMSDARKYHGNL
jgi:hypothetical protein